MKKDVSAALDNIDMVYNDLVVIANDIYTQQLGETDLIISRIYENIENLSNDDLRSNILRLSLKSYGFSEIKEKSAFKATLAETIRKEAHATAYGSAEGTAAAKENQAVLNTSSEILSEEIYDLVANLFKVKLDELHRLVAAMQSVLMSKMQEAKLTMSALE